MRPSFRSHLTAGPFALIKRFRLESAAWLIGAASINLLTPHGPDGIPKASTGS